MKVVDESEDRPDLARRGEVKYAVDHADVDAIRSVLCGSCQQMVHNKRISKVRSIYFDDATLSACRANIDGVWASAANCVYAGTMLPNRAVTSSSKSNGAKTKSPASIDYRCIHPSRFTI